MNVKLYISPWILKIILSRHSLAALFKKPIKSEARVEIKTKSLFQRGFSNYANKLKRHKKLKIDL